MTASGVVFSAYNFVIFWNNLASERQITENPRIQTLQGHDGSLRGAYGELTGRLRGAYGALTRRVRGAYGALTGSLRGAYGELTGSLRGAYGAMMGQRCGTISGM